MSSESLSPIFALEKTKIFEKNLTKILKKNKNLENKIIKALSTLSENPQYPSLKSHQVDLARYGKVWSSWAAPDLRIIWKYHNDKIIILLLDIGSHDEVY
jgi:mRNA-degrading endonuclease YafQ of YafQ-DinJ toxin-antitoxin module